MRHRMTSKGKDTTLDTAPRATARFASDCATVGVFPELVAKHCGLIRNIAQDGLCHSSGMGLVNGADNLLYRMRCHRRTVPTNHVIFVYNRPISVCTRHSLLCLACSQVIQTLSDKYQNPDQTSQIHIIRRAIRSNQT